MKNIRNVCCAAAAVIMFAVMGMVFSPHVHAANNATNYEPKYGPHSEMTEGGWLYYYGIITIDETDQAGNWSNYYVFHGGNELNEIEGARYDLKTNTLILENFRHPHATIYASEMGDDFTIKVIGNCEIATLDVHGFMHEHGGELGEPLYYGGSLNLTGPGKLTITNSEANDDNPWGFMIWGEGSESQLKISKHTSLEVTGYGTEAAIMIIRSAGFYSDQAITIDGKALSSVYPQYQVKGFENEAEPTLKDYWVDASKVEVKGDGIADIENAPLVLSDQYLPYNGKVQTPDIISVDGKALTEGVDFTASYSPSSPKAVGKYTVTIKGKGKYTGSSKASFTIIPESIEGARISGLTARNYTGKAITQAPVVKVGSMTLKAGTDYNISYKNNIKVGTATITFTGKGNYCDSLKKTFTIKKGINTLAVKAKTVSVKHSKLKKSTQILAVSKVIYFSKKGQGTISYVKAGGSNRVTIKKTTGKVTIKKGTKKGTYKVKVKVKAAGNASYFASPVKVLTIQIEVK